jgi:hypothetical protein
MCRIDAFERANVQGNVEGGNGSDGEVKHERKEEDHKNRNYYVWEIECGEGLT